MKVTTNKGTSAFERKIKLAAKRAQNPEGVWPKVGSYLSHTAQRQFVTEGMYLLGHRWKPLKPDYRLRKIRAGYSRKILVASGAMRASLTSRPMDIETYQGDTATFGSTDPKVNWHHYGTRRHGQRVNPPRPILVFTTEVRSDLKDIMVAYVLGKKATWR